MPNPRAVSKPTPQAIRARQEYAKVPRKTKADDPGRYTKTPHDYGDVLIAGGKLGGPLMRDVLYWIERHTWGNPKRPEYAKLSLTQLARLCQSWDADKNKLRPAERKSIAVVLAYLEKHGIITARERKGCSANTAKMYKLSPENWKAAPPYTAPSAAEIADAEKDADDEEEGEDTPTDRDQQQGSEVTVSNGKLSRPQPVAVRTAKDAAPVTIRLVYNPTGFDFPLTVRPQAGANGRIVLNFSPHRGEGEAKGCSSPQPHFAKKSTDNKRFIDFESAVTAISRRVWGEAPEDELVHRIMTAALDAPVSLFESIANRRLKSRDAGHQHSPGLLVNLAAEAARKWAKAGAQEPAGRAAADSRPSAPRVTDEELERFAAEGDADAAELLAARKGGRRA